MTIDDLLRIPPYSLIREQKEKLMTERLFELTKHHVENCPEYAAMMRGVGFDADVCSSFNDLPFLPVCLFKELELKSISRNDVFKVMTSSGTTGQTVSKIFLDRNAAGVQQKVLVKIVSGFIDSARMPMLIIDSPSVIKDRAMFSARGAGILGFSIFGTDRVYALNDEMEIDFAAVTAFLEKHSCKRILLFGFTFMVWQHFYMELIKNKYKLNLENAVLIHGGGWKRLDSNSVSKNTFKNSLTDAFGLTDIHDYYGMIEQTGCVYMECEHGHLHTSIFSDIITRRHTDFSRCDIGEPGIIQVVSVLPESYPGHSLLTEDEGVILGEDCCPCGRRGKYFAVNGRLKMAEIRGCSDTYAAIM